MNRKFSVFLLLLGLFMLSTRAQLPHRFFLVESTLTGASLKEEQFRFVNVTVLVRDSEGIPIENAEVKAFSEDWGIRYPHIESFERTDVNGSASFRIPIGNWSFFAGGGYDFAASNLGAGYFAVLPYHVISEDCELWIQPDDAVVVEVFDFNKNPLDFDRVYLMTSDHVPVVLPPLVGKTQNGSIAVEVVSDLEYEILFVKNSLPGNAYLIHETEVQPGSNILVELSTATEVHLSYHLFDASNVSTTGEVFLSMTNFSIGENGGINWIGFPIEGSRDIFISPSILWIQGPRINLGDQVYSFLGYDYNFLPGSAHSFSFGGAVHPQLKVVPTFDTQACVWVIDQFGNIMDYSWSWNRHGRFPALLKVFQNSELLFELNLNGTPTPSCGRHFSPEEYDSLTYQLNLDLGDFGTWHLSGKFISNETSFDYKTISTEHFDIKYFGGTEQRAIIIADQMEKAYQIQADLLEDEHQRRLQFNLEITMVGMAGGDTMWMGMMSQWTWYGPSYTSSPNFVAFHELGHLLQPKSIQHGKFDENFASLLSTEAIRGIFGSRVGLFNKGMHSIDFFAYLDRLRENSEPQFILNYLTKIYGFDLHNDFFKLWEESDPNSPRSKIKNQGFTIDESIAIIYSYSIQENLAWLYQLCDINVEETRIDQGLNLICTQTIDHSITVDGSVFHVTTETNSSILSLEFNRTKKAISFLVVGPNGTTGICNVTIPQGLLWGQFYVSKDNVTLVKGVDYFETSNDTSYIFYITYTHTTHIIEIRATEVIPEFPSFVILPLLMLATVPAVIVCKRKTK